MLCYALGHGAELPWRDDHESVQFVCPPSRQSHLALRCRAGDRVVTDPLCKPFSMGRNLFCVHSRKRLDDIPELKAAKVQQNRRTLIAMGTKFLQVRYSTLPTTNYCQDCDGAPVWFQDVVLMVTATCSRSTCTTTLQYAADLLVISWRSP